MYRVVGCLYSIILHPLWMSLSPSKFYDCTVLYWSCNCNRIVNCNCTLWIYSILFYYILFYSILKSFLSHVVSCNSCILLYFFPLCYSIVILSYSFLFFLRFLRPMILVSGRVLWESSRLYFHRFCSEEPRVLGEFMKLFLPHHFGSKKFFSLSTSKRPQSMRLDSWNNLDFWISQFVGAWFLD